MDDEVVAVGKKLRLKYRNVILKKSVSEKEGVKAHEKDGEKSEK